MINDKGSLRLLLSLLCVEVQGSGYLSDEEGPLSYNAHTKQVSIVIARPGMWNLPWRVHARARIQRTLQGISHRRFWGLEQCISLALDSI